MAKNVLQYWRQTGDDDVTIAERGRKPRAEILGQHVAQVHRRPDGLLEHDRGGDEDENAGSVEREIGGNRRKCVDRKNSRQEISVQQVLNHL